MRPRLRASDVPCVSETCVSEGLNPSTPGHHSPQSKQTRSFATKTQRPRVRLPFFSCSADDLYLALRKVTRCVMYNSRDPLVYDLVAHVRLCSLTSKTGGPSDWTIPALRKSFGVPRPPNGLIIVTYILMEEVQKSSSIIDGTKLPFPWQQDMRQLSTAAVVHMRFNPWAPNGALVTFSTHIRQL
jgi:hypothetical protein